MNNIIRLTTAVGRVNVANPKDCLEEIINVLAQSSEHESDITLLPRLALCSPSSGDLLGNSQLMADCRFALNQLNQHTKDRSGYIIVGTALEDLGRPVSAIAVLHKGETITLVPTTGDPKPLISSGFSERFSYTSATLAVGDMRVQIFTERLANLVSGAARAAANLCDLLLVPIYEPMVAGQIKEICQLTRHLSSSLGIAIAVVNGGVGDTSHPYFYHGFTSVYESGHQLSLENNFSHSFSATVDLDLDILRSQRPSSSGGSPSVPIHKLPLLPKTGRLIRQVSRNPFLPETSWEKSEYMSVLFNYQVQSLTARMENTGIKKLVVGVSGGIDSTVALLVSVAACDYLELPRDNIHAITLPGLGTSDRTYKNAVALLDRLNVTAREISIKQSVELHFKDISHDGSPDTTYENAQARERTQVLLDISNMVGGLVVGSSDLSEEALGFSTFGGDHMAGYNVNCCMTKTMLRELLAHMIDTELYPEVSSILKDVLATPVSPELLPPSESGEILQKTEDILGPYELHEFFLYYFVGYKLSPQKIYKYACLVFSGTVSEHFIKEKLVLFLRKFSLNQFKRSFAPDGSAITQVNLLGVTYSIPSDLDYRGLVDKLENLN